MTKLFRLLLSMIVIALATAASPTPSANAATLTAVAPVAEGRVLDPIAKPRGTLALSHFYPVPGPLRLGDVSGNANLFIPLAQAAVVKDAVIDIHYTNSIALQVNRSVLEIRLNDFRWNYGGRATTN